MITIEECHEASDRLRKLAKGPEDINWGSLTEAVFDDSSGHWRTDVVMRLSDLINLGEDTDAYNLLPDKDREAIAWIQDHGGLKQVETDYLMGECFAELADRVAARLGVNIEGLDAQDSEPVLMEAIDRHMMPDGVEWPRYEDGEPVRFSDKLDEFAHTVYKTVRNVRFHDNGLTVIDNGGGSALETLVLAPSERVKRPAPEVLDADGVEVEVGDDLYSVEGMIKFHVSAIDRKSGRIATEAMLAIDRWADPAMYTHRAPVLAADGLPLREGEHVYHVETGAELVVKELPKPGEYQAVVVFALPTSPASHLTSFDPDMLTHERPVADTWERLEEDAGKDPCCYFGFGGEEACGKCPASGKNCEQTMARNLVRRARALAGVSE